MYKLKYFQCGEQREIHSQVNGHNRWPVFSAFAFYFWPRNEALEQIWFILMHCALAQISEQSWSPWPVFLLDENGLQFALQESTWGVSTIEGYSVHGIQVRVGLKSPPLFWKCVGTETSAVTVPHASLLLLLCKFIFQLNLQWPLNMLTKL